MKKTVIIWLCVIIGMAFFGYYLYQSNITDIDKMRRISIEIEENSFSSEVKDGSLKFGVLLEIELPEDYILSEKDLNTIIAQIGQNTCWIYCNSLSEENILTLLDKANNGESRLGLIGRDVDLNKIDYSSDTRIIVEDTQYGKLSRGEVSYIIMGDIGAEFEFLSYVWSHTKLYTPEELEIILKSRKLK